MHFCAFLCKYHESCLYLQLMHCATTSATLLPQPTFFSSRPISLMSRKVPSAQPKAKALSEPAQQCTVSHEVCQTSSGSATGFISPESASYGSYGSYWMGWENYLRWQNRKLCSARSAPSLCHSASKPWPGSEERYSPQDVHR